MSLSDESEEKRKAPPDSKGRSVRDAEVEASLSEESASERVSERVENIAAKLLPRRRRVWLISTAITGAILVLLVISGITFLYFWASSPAFEDQVRRRVIATLEENTGGRVEIASFHWDILHLSFDASGITIHGREGPGEEPYARVGRLHAELGVFGLFTSKRRVILHSLDCAEPAFHLIVYPDGSTNAPQPRIKPKPGKPVLDTIFDLRIGQFTVENGSLHIADKVIPLDWQVKHAAVNLAWASAMGAQPEPGAEAADEPSGLYRMTVSLGELSFAQGPLVGKAAPMIGHLDLIALLAHNSLRVESMNLTSLNRTLTMRGGVSDFAHARWDAQASGEVDVRVFEGAAGFPFTRAGIVRLDASANGRGGEFEILGGLTGTNIHYEQQPFVNTQVRDLTARFRATASQLLVSDVRAHPVTGGEVSGEFFYDNWLVFTPQPGSKEELQFRRTHTKPPTSTGRIRGKVSGMSLDGMLVQLAAPQYRKLGLDTIVSGPVNADWTNMATDLTIGGKLALVPSGKTIPGEAPVYGTIDGLFHANEGAVHVQTLDVHLPHTSLEGKGLLGVFPIDRASEMDLDLISTDLSEFDPALRALEFHSGTRVGTAALPAVLNPNPPGGKVLSGQATFHGQLNSSWITPRVDGRLTAVNIGLEIPPATANGPPRFFAWDSVDADGIYSPASIVIRHAALHRGSASLEAQGRIDSSNPSYNLLNPAPAFDENSSLQIKADARQFPVEELLPLASVSAPVTGTLNAHLDFQGQVNALAGSGTLDLLKAKVYGVQLDRLRAAGTLQNSQIKLTSFSVEQGTGRLTGTGGYDLHTNAFQVDARGASIQLASLLAAGGQTSDIKGQLAVTLIGDGTFDNPHVQARATLSGMTVASEPVADLLINVSTRPHTLLYDLSSHQVAGVFTAHGETTLNSDFSTKAKLQFSKFDIGALLKLLKVTGINGQSDLEGTAQVDGPLAHPEKLTGEASLAELAVVIEGVHLASKGAVHASIANGVAHLDPVEITGEDTDIKLRGSLGLTGKQQLDVVADGSVNLRLAESIDTDLNASGVTSFQMEAHGPLLAPILQGKAEFRNASLALGDFPNGLSQINGSLEFIQNRLEVRSLTAMSGGGQLNLAGYLGFQRGLYADLTVTGLGIRLRYPQGISSLADAHLHLQGPQSNLLLSGDVLVTRFAINDELDLAALTAQATAVQPVLSPDAPSNHVRLDVHLTSAPQLNFQNAYAKLAGDVDLHLRGTIAAPSLLGRISLTEGSASVAGTRYDLERGDINFNNPVRIQPNIDLDATARVEDYDITLGLHGTTDKLNVTYRSEPPLPEADVIALLALGRTSEEGGVNMQQQQQAGDNPTTDALLGGALNATVSNRVQRLFGTGAVKVDPNFIGTIGNSSARVTVVEQIGQNLTFTFASNVNSTAQQLIQADIAINHHVSMLVTQDESGIFSVVFKIRRRFR